MKKLIFAMMVVFSFSVSAAFACTPGYNCVKPKTEKLACDNPKCGKKSSEKIELLTCTTGVNCVKPEKLACNTPPCKVPHTKKVLKLTKTLPCTTGVDCKTSI
jgi:hypothetical protein